MGRMLCAAGIFLLSYASIFAQEMTLNAGSGNDLLCRALDSFVVSKAKAGDMLFSPFVKDGASLLPKDPGKYITGKTSFEYDLASGEIEVQASAIFGGSKCTVVYREKLPAAQLIRDLDDRADITGYRDNPAFRNIMLEELTSYRSAYFFATAAVSVKKGDVIISFVPLAVLPSFVPKSPSFSCTLGRAVKLKGAAEPYGPEAESGFDKACTRCGMRSSGEAELTALMGPAAVERREYRGMHVPSVSGRVELAKGSMLLASSDVTGKGSAHMNARTAESTAYSLWGERCAEWAVRALARTSFRLDPSGRNAARREEPKTEARISERDVQVVCRLKAGEKERNPFLPEFEAAFLSVFSGSESPAAPYSAVVELAPVYDQGSIGNGFVSKRVYCIIWVFRGKERIYSCNVSDAAVGLAAEAAGKEAAIKAAKKAAQTVKNFIEGKQP